MNIKHYLYLLGLALTCSAGAQATSLSYPLDLKQGWNLLGNSLSSPINVKTSFGSQTNVVTLWKWNALSRTWAFYAPSLDANGTLSSYAASKGYSVLDTINPGEGYWVNSTVASAMGNQSGTGMSLGAASLNIGWNLSATGDAVTPAAFSSSTGNITTLWAWDNSNNSWYFFAPSLHANNTLASYIASKGYQGFGTQTLGSGRGFWINCQIACTSAAPAIGALQGIWQSTTGSGATASSTSVIVLPDGLLWAVLADASSTRLIKASLATQGSAFGGTGKSYTLGAAGSSSAAITANAVAKTSLSGSISTATTSGTQLDTVSLTYQSRYDTAAVLADFAGNWQAMLGSGRTNWTITSTGTISGSRTTGCTYSGQISLRAEAKAVTDAAVTETCAGTVIQLQGVATLSADKALISMALSTADEASGLVLGLRAVP